ncbi:MAG: hypothetical protein ACYTF6_06630, partial [Planctomycetota bacterium]
MRKRKVRYNQGRRERGRRAVDSFTLNKIEFDAVRHIISGFACCTLGRTLALRISPSRNPQVIRRWLKQTSQMIQAMRDVGLPPFGGVTDVSAQLKRAKPGGGASGEDFAAIASALEGANNVRGYLNSLPEELDELREFAKAMGNFREEVELIQSIVDARGGVRDDASQRLAEIRKEIADITKEIHDSIYGYLRDPEIAKLLQDATVTLHGDRYVLPVKVENRGRLPGVVHR